MYASECRRYAEQCLQLAQALASQYRNLLFEWADEWRKVAAELEELDPQEYRFSDKQMDGWLDLSKVCGRYRSEE